MTELTPMMQQYFRLKEQHKDCLLFFRLGDFYEMFFDDAERAAKELDLVLTTRDRNKPEAERTPMCGVPYHSAEAYIARLIQKGYKVAICEQMEEAAGAKGIVERQVVRVITPGTVTDPAMLEDGRNNYIAALWAGEEGAGLAVSDISTGEVAARLLPGEDWAARALSELERYQPRELLLSPSAALPRLLDPLREAGGCRLELGSEQLFDAETASENLQRQFGAQLSALPPEAAAARRALGGLLQYLYQTQQSKLAHLQRVRYHQEGEFIELDPVARRNLELTETLRGKEKRGSLLWVIDKTKTPMGGRLIRAWMERPLRSPAAIRRRQAAVSALVGDALRRAELALCLKEITDLERIIGRVVFGSAGGRDLLELAAGLSRIEPLRALLQGQEGALLSQIYAQLDALPELQELIGRAIADAPPLSLREGGLIRAGYHQEVDRLRELIQNSRAVIARMEAEEKEATGIKSLRIRYNKVFGYYIEVSKSYYSQVPEHYIRKQTLVNSERYITEPLKNLEHELLSAQERITALEFQLFSELRAVAASYVSQVQSTAALVAQLDVLCSFALLAAENHYCEPTVDDSNQLEIAEGRHPVVEKVLKESLFVPNDTYMDENEQLVAIITGPNMAGKSTYMRQVAQIVLLAQMGSFVPAKSARIGVIDQLFTRVGASDDLAGGQSTFMVEMREVAEILKRATKKSLVILDEVGRGTSTYDGMAIARAVLEYCADRKRLGVKTLFATHYHELTELEQSLPTVKNYHIAAKKRGEEILFLRKIIPGRADESYGVEVAKLAGVPEAVVRRGRAILKELEAEGHVRQLPASPKADTAGQCSLEEQQERAVLQRLRQTAVETLTPLEAMNLLYELKQGLV